MQVIKLEKTDPLTKNLEAAKQMYLALNLIVQEAHVQVSQVNKPLMHQFNVESQGLVRSNVLQALIAQMERNEKKYRLQQKLLLRVEAEKLLLLTGAEVLKTVAPEKWEKIKVWFDLTSTDPKVLSVQKQAVELTLRLDPTL